MSDIDDAAAQLIQNKAVHFSCPVTGKPGKTLQVLIRECEDYDFVEYDQPYEAGSMFEIGPSKVKTVSLRMTTAFSSIEEAGNAVLVQRAKILGVPWGYAQQ